MNSMEDTSTAVAVRFQKMIMKRGPLERLLMGCSMFDSAKQIVKNAILNQNPEIKPQRMKEEIFLRFYGMEFNKAEKEKILNVLKNVYK